MALTSVPPIDTSTPLTLDGVRQDMPNDPKPVVSGDGWEDVTKPEVSQWQDVTRPDAATLAASSTFHPPEQAGQALEEAKHVGISPEGTVLDPESWTRQRLQENFRKSIEGSPGVRAYAEQSTVNASAISKDFEKMTGVEFYLTGKNFPDTSRDLGPMAGPTGRAQVYRDLVPPVWSQALHKAVDSFKADFEAMRDLFDNSKEAQKRLAEYNTKAAEPMIGADTNARKVVGGVSEVGANVAAIVGASAILGPEAAPIIMGAQNAAGLMRSGVKDELAVGAGFVIGALGAGIGKKFFGALTPEMSVGYKSAAEQALKGLALHPTFSSFAKGFGHHAAAGWLMNEAMAVSDALVVEHDRFTKTGEWDESRIGEAARHAAVSGLSLLPFAAFGALNEHFAQQGRWVQARQDAARIGSLGALLNDSSFVAEHPEEAKDLIRRIKSPDFHVSPDAFERVAKAMNVEPEELAKKLVGDDGSSWRASRDSQTPIKLPASSLVDLREHLDKLSKDAKLDPSGDTINESVGPPRRAFEPSFKNMETGEVTRTGAFHDVSVMGEAAINDVGSGKLVAGFSDPNDKFYTRAEAAEALDVKGKELLSGGLASEDLAGAKPIMRAALRDVSTGLIYTGQTHPEIYNTLPKEVQKKFDPEYNKDSPDQGFVDQTGKFYTRSEAALAGGSLTSEYVKPKAPEVVISASGKKAAPLPGTGDASVSELRRYAENVVGQRTLGALVTDVFKRARDRAQKAVEGLQAQAVERLAKAVDQAQGAVEAGVKSGEKGRSAASMNMQFSRTARLREWLKGLVMPEKSQSTAPKDDRGIERWRTETGLYDIPGVNIQVEKPLAERWRDLSTAQKQEAMARFKESAREQQTAEDRSVRSTLTEVKAGESSAEAMRQAQIRNLNAALEKAREKAVERGQKIADYLGKAGNGRDATYKGGTHFGAAFDHILQSLGLRVPDSTTPNIDLRGALDMVMADVGELGFDRQHLELLAAEKKGKTLDDLIPWEAENVYKAVKQLRFLADQATKTNVRGAMVERDGQIKTIDANLAKGGKPGQHEQYTEPSRSQRRKADQAQAEQLLHVLGDWGDDHLTQMYHALKTASDLHLKLMPSVELPKELQGPAEEMVPMLDVNRKDPRLQFVPQEVKIRDVMRASMMAGNHSGMAKLAKGWGVTPMEVEFWLQRHMTEPMWKYVQSHWDANADLFKMEAEVHARRSGQLPLQLEPRQIHTPYGKFTGGYSPFRWDTTMSPRVPPEGFRAGLDSPHAFVKERNENFFGTPNISFGALKGHYNELIQDVAFGDLSRDVGHMVKDPMFRASVLQYKGKPWLHQLDNFHEQLRQGSVPDPVGTDYYDRFISGARGLYAAGVFNANFPVLGGVLMHPTIAAPGLRLSPASMAKAFGKMLTPDGWREAGGSDVVGFRNDGYREKQNRMWEQTLGYNSNRWQRGLSFASQEAQHAVDTVLSRFFYHAGKFQAVADGADPEEAARHADHIVSRAMPPMTRMQASALVRSKQWGLLTLVRNFPNTVMNMQEMDKWDTRVGIAEGDNAAWAWTKVAGRRAGMIGGLTLGLYAMGRGRDDGEKLWQWAGRNIITEHFYGYPIGHLLAEAFAPMAMGEGFHPGRIKAFGTPISEYADRLATDIGHLMQRDRPVDKKLFDALDFSGRTIGAPLPPSLLRSAEGAYKLYKWHFLGENDFYHMPRGLLDEASIVGYGERRGSTPLNDLQGAIR